MTDLKKITYRGRVLKLFTLGWIVDCCWVIDTLGQILFNYHVILERIAKEQSILQVDYTTIIYKLGDSSWGFEMSTTCSPHGHVHLRPWVRWGGSTSNRCPPHGYIWTPLPFHPYLAVTLVGLWLLNNHCHSETEVSWRPPHCGLCSWTETLLHHIKLHTFSIPHMTP